MGAIHDSVMLIAVHDVGHTHLARTLSNLAFQSYRVLKIFPGQLYSWSRFLEHVGPRDFLRHSEHGSTFQRGLPSDSELGDLETADIFSSVLRDGSVTEADVNIEKLRLCSSNGWLHSDTCQGETTYFFPSPLHEWYIEWKLFDTLTQCSN